MPPQAHIYSSITLLSLPQQKGSFGALALQFVSTSASLPRLASSWRSHLEPGLSRSGRNARATSHWQPNKANYEFLERVVGSSSHMEERTTIHPPGDKHKKMLQLGCWTAHSLVSHRVLLIQKSLVWFKLTSFYKCKGTGTYARSQSTELWKLLLKLT